MQDKLGRFMRNTGALRFFGPMGLILIIFGIIMTSTSPKEYKETVGTVTNVTSYVDDEETRYSVEFDYTVDGKTYSNSFDGFSEEPKVGDKITVYYGADNPEAVSTTKHSGLIGIVMVVLGVLALGYGIFSFVRATKKSRELDEKTKAGNPNGTTTVEPLPKSMLTEYYVSFDGHGLKPGYVVEDKARAVVFEGTMAKNALVGSRTFTFVNHKTGKSTDHAVGHTTTVGIENEMFSNRSWFSFDGKNVWDVLHDQGVRLSTDILSKFPKLTYTASQNGQFLATIETASRYVHEEDEAAHAVKIPYGKYYYRVWTNSQDLDLLFLTVFAISETEQTLVE